MIETVAKTEVDPSLARGNGRLWLKETYSALERLAGSIFLSGENPEQRFMAMFTACFDASGNSIDQPYVIVSGYLANYGQWLNFEKQWSYIHDYFGVEKPFHMADFVSATTNPTYKNQKNARADYVDIAKDPKASDAFLRGLSQAQVTNVHCAFSCIVDMGVYDNVSSLIPLKEAVPPYALGAQMCMERVRQWGEYFNIPEEVECIFETGDFGQGRLSDLMVEEGKNPPIYKKKADFAGLQGADHYAWEQYNALRKHSRLQSEFQARDICRFLISAIPKRATRPDLAWLVRFCERKGIDPRTGVKK